MDILVNAIDALGLLLAMGCVAYWCYALRIVVEKEANLMIKLFFVAMLIMFPLITPAIIYILYLNLFKRKQFRANS